MSTPLTRGAELALAGVCRARRNGSDEFDRGFQGMPNAAHYAATKAYVQALAEALYVELSPLGVDVLASAPGPTNSGFAARAGMRMGMALNPSDVAQSTLDALGRKSTVLPGFLSKLLTYALVPLPRWGRVRIMGRVMRGMTKHRHRITDLGPGQDKSA
jgi:short-subunit dehydrogenase